MQLLKKLLTSRRSFFKRQESGRKVVRRDWSFRTWLKFPQKDSGSSVIMTRPFKQSTATHKQLQFTKPLNENTAKGKKFS